MEFLLNLTWLLLALPADWLWQDCRSARVRRRSSLQCFFSLGCLLIILFPVISATDDLRAMRAEVEESPISKRSISANGPEKSSCCKIHSPSALALAYISFRTDDAAWRWLSIALFSIPPFPAVRPMGRAPPIAFLG